MHTDTCIQNTDTDTGANWAANRPVPPIHMWRSGTLVRGGLSLAPGAAEVRRQGLVCCSALLFALVSFS